MSGSPWLPFVAAGLVVLAAWGFGRPLLGRLLTGDDASDAPRWFVELMLGVAALMTVAFPLAALGWLHPVTIHALVLIGAAMGASWLWRARHATTWRRLEPGDLPTGLALLFAISFFPSVASPVLQHDDNVYHLLLPKVYLAAHGFVDLPTSLFANMPHAVELLYTFPYAMADFTAPKALVFLVAMATLVAIGAAVRPGAGALGAGVVVGAVVAGKNLQWHLGLGYVEPILGALVLAATLSLVAWWRTHHRGWLLSLALLCGAAATVKYTAWLFVALLGGTAVISLLRDHDVPARARARTAGAMALGFSLPLVPWLVKSAVATGNPVYPVFFRWFGGRLWTETQVLHSQSSVRHHGGGLDKSFIDYLAAPYNLTVRDDFYNGPSFSIALMVLFLLSAGLVLARRSDDSAQRPLAMLAVAGCLAWLVTLSLGRYLLAWVPVVALVAATAVARVRGRPALQLGALLFVLATGWWQLTNQRYPYRPTIEAITSPRAALLPHNHLWDVSRRLEELVPPDGRVLAMWENRFFFFEREVEIDSVYQAPTGLARLRATDDPHRFATALAETGVTHVVINGAEMKRYVENAYGWDLIDPVVYPRDRYERDLELLRRFVEEELELVDDIGPHGLFQLRASAAQRPSSSGGAEPTAR